MIDQALLKQQPLALDPSGAADLDRRRAAVRIEGRRFSSQFP
jgi:hypothetical protein